MADGREREKQKVDARHAKEAPENSQSAAFNLDKPT